MFEVGDKLVALDYHKEEHGIEPAAAAVAVAGPAVGGEAAASAEKTEFNVVLKSPGGAKLQIVKFKNHCM